MIIDWTKACTQIHNTKKLLESDSLERKIKFKQEIIYVKYLSEILKYEPRQCFYEWRQIKNGVASMFEGDIEQVMSQFLLIFKKAIKSHYPDVRLDGELKPVNIYRQEVDYLNGLDMPLWTKSYLLALAVYYKFRKQYGKDVSLTTQVANWAFSQCPYINERSTGYFSQYEDQIREWCNKCDTNIISYKYDYFGKKKKTYTLNFLQKSGEVVYTCNDINCVADVLHLLEGHINAHNTKRTYREKTCSQCGKVFLATGNSKTDLCPECYKIYRRKYNTKKEYARKERKKLQNAIKTEK